MHLHYLESNHMQKQNKKVVVNVRPNKIVKVVARRIEYRITLLIVTTYHDLLVHIIQATI